MDNRFLSRIMASRIATLWSQLISQTDRPYYCLKLCPLVIVDFSTLTIYLFPFLVGLEH